MKILLIAPRGNRLGDHDKSWKSTKSNFFKTPPIGLLNILASTPEHHEVKLIDENIEELDAGDLRDADIAGISITTASAERGYEIADILGKNNVLTVMGGVHASFMKEEALSHCDSIVVGEGEILWRELLHDFETGGKEAVQKEYSGSRPAMKEIPFPDTERTDAEDKYLLSNLFNITRGCPHNCNFCSVTELLGKKLRLRPVEDVVNHIKMKLEKGGTGIRNRFFVFVDDNVLANRVYAKELFRALIPLKILWISQASINSAYDEELLELAAESGCRGIFIGLESISSKALKEIGKKQNKISFYKEGIDRFHKKGIFVEAGFIFGFDSDTVGVFNDTVKTAEKLRLDGVQYTILTPLPGTDLYRKMSAEGRLLHRNWSEFDCTRAVFRPAGMSIGELQNGLHWAYRKTYSIPGILKRILPALFSRRAVYFLFILAFNLGYRKSFAYMRKQAVRPVAPAAAIESKPAAFIAKLEPYSPH